MNLITRCGKNWKENEGARASRLISGVMGEVDFEAGRKDLKVGLLLCNIPNTAIL